MDGHARTPPSLQFVPPDGLSSPGSRDWRAETKAGARAVIEHLLLRRPRKRPMVPDAVEIPRELPIPVGDVRRVDEMVVTDEIDHLREEAFARLDAEVDR